MTETTPADEIVTTMRSLEAEWARAGRSLAAVMPREMAGALSLMTQPAAIASASTVFGLGTATHAATLWMGTWMGVAENMQRVMSQPFTAAGAHASQQAAQRARSAADTLIADAKSLADEIVKPTAKPAAPARKARPVAPARGAAAQKQAPAMPVAIEKPAAPDDLKAISGVGPKLEQVLNSLGIWTYDQIAALTPAEIDWIEDYLAFKGRIGRDGWLSQAAELSAATDG